MIKLPKTVKVGSQTYKIIERLQNVDATLGGAYAYTLVDENLIVMRQDLHIERKRSILIHELLHALIFTFSRSDRVERNDNYDDWEHHFITMIQEPLTMLLRDNPDLVDFLLDDDA